MRQILRAQLLAVLFVVVVGGLCFDHGRAFAFQKSGTAWILEARLTAEGGLPESEIASLLSSARRLREFHRRKALLGSAGRRTAPVRHLSGQSQPGGG